MRHKMNIALVLCCLCMPLLASCLGPSGVGDELLYSEWHRTGCPGFPSLAEVESVLAEHQELVQRIESIPDVAFGVGIGDCPGGSYLKIYIGGAATGWEIFEILDEAGAREEGPRTFFGVPFLLNNV